MKKSVIVLIGIIYIASIALVSFFGLQYKTFNDFIYVSSIEILNEDLTSTEGVKDRTAFVYADENGDFKYQINYRVGPDNASVKVVDFVISGDKTLASVDSNGIVTFDKNKVAEEGIATVIVWLVSTDQSNIESEHITLTALDF